MTWIAVVQDAVSRHRNERLPVQWHNYLLATAFAPHRRAAHGSRQPQAGRTQYSHGGGPWGGWYSPWLGKYKAMYPGLEDRLKGEYLTEAITAKAVEIISQAAKDDVPFFMNMAHFAVHTAIAPAPDKYLDHYKDGRPRVERDYASMLEAMDASLGSGQVAG